MNLILFGFCLILLCFNAPYMSGEAFQITDILPDFVGYLILWYTLEKRRINRHMKGVYTAVSVMTLVSFLFFLAQIQTLFTAFLEGDGLILGWILKGLAFVAAEYSGAILLAASLIFGWFFLSLLKHWNQTRERKLQRTVCKAGMVLCGIVSLCNIGDCFIILPFSWHWISYPLSLLAVVAAWFVMKDIPDMEYGKRS